MVIWIIGLSGAGKTTLAREVARLARPARPNLVYLDGDLLREVWGSDLGHDLEGRRKNADRICRLGKLLDEQGIDVVCAVLSLFPDCRRWNRENLSRYHEVFIDCPMESLVARDSKGLYRRALAGELKNVAGVDLPFPRPESADLTIVNEGDLGALLAHAPRLAALLK